MRLDPEVAAAAERLRQERHMGLNQVVNELARADLDRAQKTTRFQQRTASVGLKIDVTNVAGAVEQLDAYDAQADR